MTRRHWAILIFVLWAAAFAWLIKREYFRTTAARLAEAALSVPPGAVFYRLDLGAQQVGWASTTIDTLRDSIKVEDALVLDVPARGRLRHTAARSSATLSRALRLLHIQSTYEGADGAFRTRGEVLADTVLRFSVIAGRDSTTTYVRLDRPVVLESLLPLRLAFGAALKPGAEYDLRVLNPLLLTLRQVHVTVARESTLVVPDSAEYDSTAMVWIAAHFDTASAFRLEETSGDGAQTVWVDAQGHVVVATRPAGVVETRSAFEIVHENFRHRDTLRLMRASASPAPGDVVPASVLDAGITRLSPAAGEFRVVLSGATPDGLAIDGPRQRVADDTLWVAAAAPESATYRLPSTDTALARFRQPEPLIPSLEPTIRGEARSIVGAERDPARAVAALNHWVSTEIRRTAGADPPSAALALAARSGDCDAHVLLLVALARAAGIPARPAAGLLYAEGRFYYHAWAEVYVGRWETADPTFDQFPADAHHLRFATGGLARTAELTRTIGRLKLQTQ
ncbi:MAG TPA: transglutaminase-like domain-containing protein [Gemmatimonadales bacterium]|nr:transglutaminase-like domain-containing protein [Gemmatimonadales bacterium]